MTTLETPRLILRPWAKADRAPFAALNADPVSMQHFPAPLSRAESDEMVDAMIAFRAETGFCFSPVARKEDGAFIGMVGLHRVRFTAPSLEAEGRNPRAATRGPSIGDVEIGWRILRDHEGQGYVTEAARAWLAHGFGTLGLERIVAFTVPANMRSRAVMARLGMAHVEGGDFDHPRLAEGHPLRRHVLYAITRDAFAAAR
jgi:RimJ/RimL family protein N-acetyltransferase